MATRKRTPTPRKASGRNIAESERNTVAVKLRLTEAVRAALDALRARRGQTRSEAVAALVAAATERRMSDYCGWRRTINDLEVIEDGVLVVHVHWLGAWIDADTGEEVDMFNRQQRPAAR